MHAGWSDDVHVLLLPAKIPARIPELGSLFVANRFAKLHLPCCRVDVTSDVGADHGCDHRAASECIFHCATHVQVSLACHLFALQPLPPRVCKSGSSKKTSCAWAPNAQANAEVSASFTTRIAIATLAPAKRAQTAFDTEQTDRCVAPDAWQIEIACARKTKTCSIQSP